MLHSEIGPPVAARIFPSELNARLTAVDQGPARCSRNGFSSRPARSQQASVPSLLAETSVLPSGETATASTGEEQVNSARCLRAGISQTTMRPTGFLLTSALLPVT